MLSDRFREFLKLQIRNKETDEIRLKAELATLRETLSSFEAIEAAEAKPQLPNPVL